MCTLMGNTGGRQPEWQLPPPMAAIPNTSLDLEDPLSTLLTTFGGSAGGPARQQRAPWVEKATPGRDASLSEDAHTNITAHGAPSLCLFGL